MSYRGWNVSGGKSVTEAEIASSAATFLLEELDYVFEIDFKTFPGKTAYRWVKRQPGMDVR